MSVSGYGLGGVNVHVVLQAHIPNKQTQGINHRNEDLVSNKLFVVGGTTKKSVDLAIKKWKQCKMNASAAESLMFSRAKNYSFISVAVAQTLLQANFSDPKSLARKNINIVMVFCGQGPQYKNMCRQLYNEYPVFRTTFDNFCKETQTAYNQLGQKEKVPTAWPLV
eukprot:TRINITY_DN540_c0_g1_i2.p1 TRINITY_DN540_c0_g1~~TRINITY_DN540_c0_g1_i2.p1  ORF type:complete len:166 (-),score=30.93 TRINITY_DN540_c0_g1_i2:10-507(-)